MQVLEFNSLCSNLDPSTYKTLGKRLTPRFYFMGSFNEIMSIFPLFFVVWSLWHAHFKSLQWCTKPQ